jgi:hypothetical protein
MNIFLFVLIILLALGFLCATLLLAATIISGRTVQKMARKYPAIYAEEVLANAHQQAAQKKDPVVAPDSTQLLAP